MDVPVASLHGDTPIRSRLTLPAGRSDRPGRYSVLPSTGPRRVRTRLISVIEEGVHTVKKILVLVLVALGAFAVYRKIQADRAELDLWTEATAASEN
ncbi:hypothetical protein CLV63_10311 [Murinocardiopsis flavida]|uniref:Uncharacterized protein n=1 Tax=Murinocardiopsis flavida TaxID=645275 RepID=A0A2P8DQ26_9ACTN|nr:hypothetical protein CLV63_10311 [Murinocardiopsis flavida]